MRRVVYFIRSGQSNFYKVGIANSIKDRLKALQSGNPEILTVRFVLYAVNAKKQPQEVETKLHRVLKDHHIHGEWFSFETPLTDNDIRYWVDKIGFAVSRIKDQRVYIEQMPQASMDKTTPSSNMQSNDLVRKDTFNFLQSSGLSRFVDIHIGTGHKIAEIKTAIYDLSAQGLIERQRVNRLDRYCLKDMSQYLQEIT